MADGLRAEMSDTKYYAACALCGATDKLLVCSRCRSTWYCCKEHQKSHWKVHKPACNGLKGNESAPTSAVTHAGNGRVQESKDDQSHVGTHVPQNSSVSDLTSLLDALTEYGGPPGSNPNIDANISEYFNFSDSGQVGGNDEMSDDFMSSFLTLDNNTASNNEVMTPFSGQPGISYGNTSASYTSSAAAFSNTSTVPILSSPSSSSHPGVSAQHHPTSAVTMPTSTVFMGQGNQYGAQGLCTPPDMEPPCSGSRKPLPTQQQTPNTQAQAPVQDPRKTLSMGLHSQQQGAREGSQKETRIADYVVRCLMNYGICVVDNFIGADNAMEILKEVAVLDTLGVMQDGQLISTPSASDSVSKKVRGDKIAWIEKGQSGYKHIGNLISRLDALIMQCNGRLDKYHINGRTKAMVACYPGQGTAYMRHIDNPNGDGRCITCIYYLNKGWNVKEHGGLLRIYPSNFKSKVADVEPIFDRQIFFWSDSRNPHEVRPAFKTRYAITVWYFDAEERARAKLQYQSKVKASKAGASTSLEQKTYMMS